MGGGKGKSKGGKYHHVHTANPDARESDDRRAAKAAAMEVTRLERGVERQTASMRGFVPEGLRKRPKINPLFDLKGAARPAREHYVDPNYVPEPEPENLMESYRGNMWGHEEGRKLCELKWQLGVALHNVGSQQKRAVKTFTELLDDDPADHMNARVSLLRCHFDSGDAASARAVLDRFPDDLSVPFCFGRALMECIALMLEEDDASETLVHEALSRANAANPYAIWILGYYEIFQSAVELLEEIDQPAPGSIEEALISVTDDIELWDSVDGALDRVLEFVEGKSLPFPALPAASCQRSSSAGPATAAEDSADLYAGMFRTALEMVDEERKASAKK